MMELYIETLTGTAFELRVSPFETIMSVKAKIQRLEGIPVSQQHLIWQSVELEDDYCLHDYSIYDGATLKLVLQMRGGPINTRRIPMEDPALREMADYMEANRDELLDKLPSGNRQVTLLVFREGDQLNFFRVVDRGDGTLTPLSESLSGASMYNLYDEEEEDVEVPAIEKLEENDKTKEKMLSLRSKMESLTITKKPKVKKFKPRPPSTGRPSSSHRLRHIPPSTSTTQTVLRNPCLPPLEKIDNHETSKTQDDKDGRLNSTIEKSGPNLKRLASVSEHGSIRSEPSSDKEGIIRYPHPPSTARRKDSLKDLTYPPSSARKKEVTLESLKESLRAPPSSKPSLERRKDSRSTTSTKDLTQCESFSRPSNKYSTLDRKKDFTIESLTMEEARAMSGLLRQASIERLGSSKISNFVSNKSHKPFSRSSQGVQDVRIPTPEGRLMSAHLQRLSASRNGRIMSPTHRLPPVKSKKKSHKRCFVCTKKTGLATSYQCRCGNNFCATHRYAEAHNCTFDYKTEGRKLLEQSNPVVSAPKLPKI